MTGTRQYLDHDGRYVLAASLDEVWGRLTAVELFPTWWGWLHGFEVEGPGMAEGGVLRGEVVPPVPYRFRVAVHLDEVVEAERIVAHLTGDIAGPARLDLAEHPEGCAATIRWSVQMRQAALRMAAQVARPAIEWGHDRVVTATVRGFEEVLGAPVRPVGDARRAAGGGRRTAGSWWLTAPRQEAR